VFNCGTLTLLWGLNSWLPAYLKMARHFDVQQQGIFSSLPFFLTLLGMISSGLIADCFGRRGSLCFVRRLLRGRWSYIDHNGPSHSCNGHCIRRRMLGFGDPCIAPTFLFNAVSFDDPYGSAAVPNPFPAQYGPKIPVADVTFTKPVAIRWTFPIDFRIPRITTWNLVLERQIAGNWVARAGYYGNAGNFLQAGTGELNPAIYIPGASTVANTQSRRRYQDFANIRADRFRKQLTLPFHAVDRGKAIRPRLLAVGQLHFAATNRQLWMDQSLVCS